MKNDKKLLRERRRSQPWWDVRSGEADSPSLETNISKAKKRTTLQKCAVYFSFFLISASLSVSWL